MNFIRYTLLGDGSSDAVLLPIIRWVIDQNFPELTTVGEFARNGLPPVSEGLRARVAKAKVLYDYDVLFVHRDAERDGYDLRRRQLMEELADLTDRWIPVIPVRMTEAWLFGNEAALRRSAENPNGNISLDIPHPNRWECLPDPKEELFRILRKASNRSTRRAINEGQCRSRVSELTPDFTHLRPLQSFSAFEADVIAIFRTFEE
ncbi:hypothetical protein KDW82_12090 [Burkholderia vietnamiensis]|uniref:hypothetical protein n=1 Tax=Burkholderia TaxID=32008 RepID=UPI00130E1FC4|nr:MULTISPECIES: hypothetical protein [Burkholderia]MBR8189798.1 hypothetical protein [Burkholderia vietnamiensis]